MPVPAAITDLSTTAGSNSPAGGESPILTDDYLRAHASFIAQLYAQPLQAGMLLDFAGTSAPSGWLVCDGSAVSRTTYAALFSAIGTTWGVGDGATTFNVPDLRRRVTVGSGGSGTATLGATVGSRGGEESHTLTAGEMPAHNHGVSDPGHVHGVSDPGHSHSYTTSAQAANNAAGGIPDYITVTAGTTGTSGTGISIQGSATGITTQNAGSGSAHNVMQPSAVVTKIIKT